MYGIGGGRRMSRYRSRSGNPVHKYRRAGGEFEVNDNTGVPEPGSSHAGRGGRGRSSLPRGLRGRAIGLYYRDLHRKQNSDPELKICLDSRRESEIMKLLSSIKKKPKNAPISSDMQMNNKGYEHCNYLTHKVKEEITCQNELSKEITSQDELSENDTEQLPRIKKEITDSEMAECSDGVIELTTDDYFEDFTTEPVNPVKKYNHIGESAFKKAFLNSITGNMQDNLERSVTVQPQLIQDPKLDKDLKKDFLEKQQTSDHYKKMQLFRQKLPSYKMQREIIDLVNANQVILISGETGCGKTTQVAQFILDDCIMQERSSMCRIVCTQPRRISAISVAERVADERAEFCGVSSGYQIRVEKVLPRRKGSILFCTTGVLLQWMQSDPGLVEVSHLILDEIHERDTVSDFVITVLTDIIPKRPDLKVILMSATLNAEQFSKYFDNCPCMNIPGFTFPVEEFYLEDVLQMTNFQFKPAREAPTGWRKHLKHNKAKTRKMLEYQDFIEPYIRYIARDGKYSSSVLNSLRNAESEEMNLDLIVTLIKHICHRMRDGAILVFLPGWDKISALHRLLTDTGGFSSSRYLIIPLHSLMPTVVQRSVFHRPPPGVRKIVIATNIAETSITIDDVVYVINSGKIKMKNFDSNANIATLQAEWVSLANARQRRGRAGRVQPGICYHLYTRAREMTFANYMLPEMLRTRLDEVILQIKILQLGKVQHFLERVMDPPDSKAVEISLKLLQGMNALDEDENLTPLGYHLAQLPLDPQTGKMILMASIFSCVDPVFSVAASLSFKDAFVIPLGQEDKVNQVKEELSWGLKSDHLVLAEAFNKWQEASNRGRGSMFCRQYFLSENTLTLLKNMKIQFAEHLYRMKFLDTPNTKDHSANLNSLNTSLAKAIICAGLYPNVAIIKSVRKLKKNGIVKKKILTPEDGRVKIHPRSINDREHVFESPFLVYYLKLKSSAIYLHDTTMVHALPLLFFGEGIKYDPENEVIQVNNVLRFRCKESTANLIKELRKCLDNLLEHKISHPGVTDWTTDSDEGAILRAITELITHEDNQMELIAEEGDDADFSDY